jgi:hypothetical protein
MDYTFNLIYLLFQSQLKQMGQETLESLLYAYVNHLYSVECERFRILLMYEIMSFS